MANDKKAYPAAQKTAVNNKRVYSNAQKTAANGKKSYSNVPKTVYTNSQRMAYYSGMGYRTAYDGKKIVFSTDELRKSFQDGYKRGGRIIKTNPKKYPDNDKK